MSTENLKPPMPEPPLRFIEKGDLLLWRSWINNTAFSHVLEIKTPITPNGAEKWLKHISESTSRIDFVFEKDGKVHAFGGFTGIKIGTQTPIVGVAYIYMFVYHSLMNLGVGIDIVESLCSYGFKKLGLSKIWLHVDSDDTVARRAYEKCGFSLTYGPPPEDYHGLISYSLGKEYWKREHFLEICP